MNLRTATGFLLVLVLSAGMVFAQTDSEETESTSTDAESSDLGFGFDLGIGVQTFEEDGQAETYQQLSLRPDIAFGKFGIGLNVQLHYRFVPGAEGTQFEIRERDWVPPEEQRDFRGVMALYLPKIDYLRWARKGDPLYAKFGSIDNATLGNGFIMGGYSNMQFLPDFRILGLNLDVDGRLFNFPFIGIETAVGNVTTWDVIGARLFGRPILSLDIPVIKNLEVGTTYVRDGNPYYHADRDPNYGGTVDESAAVNIFGVDYQLPLLSSDFFSLAQFGDYVLQNGNSGGMLGIGGRAFGFMPYGAQLRFLGENFIPVYFDSTYDLYRVDKYDIYSSDVTLTDSYVGYFASLGFSFLEDRIVFDMGIDGPLGTSAALPRLTGGLTIGEGLLPGFSARASYTKSEIDEWADFTDFTNSVIDARINYQTGPAVISLVYNLRYDPYNPNQDEPWVVTSGLETSISLF